jgi:hypothetical protein
MQEEGEFSPPSRLVTNVLPSSEPSCTDTSPQLSDKSQSPKKVIKVRRKMPKDNQPFLISTGTMIAAADESDATIPSIDEQNPKDVVRLANNALDQVPSDLEDRTSTLLDEESLKSALSPEGGKKRVIRKKKRRAAEEIVDEETPTPQTMSAPSPPPPAPPPPPQ